MGESNPTFLLDKLRCFLQSLSAYGHVWVAYSGGVDSHVLLHAMATLQSEFPHVRIQAVHIHHGILPQSADWAEHCQAVCQQLKVPCRVFAVNVEKRRRESLEAVARQARYHAFAQLLQAGEYLLTAHHQDDQAETCLLQMLRGSGVKGLASMPLKAPLGNGYLVRPFLDVTRTEILAYAVQQDLCFIEDDSNHDVRFARNFLRYKILPLLRARWNNTSKVLMRVASHCAEADQLLTELGAIDMAEVAGKIPGTLSATHLKNLSIVRQKNVIRVWLHQADFLLGSSAQLERVIHDVVYARPDATPCVCWKGVEIRRYQDQLWVLRPLSPHLAEQRWIWDGKQPLVLPNDLGVLTREDLIAQGFAFPGHPVEVRFRQGGERCQLSGRRGTKSLKKLMQTWGIPPWHRDRIPLIFVNDQLVVVVGYVVCEWIGANN